MPVVDDPDRLAELAEIISGRMMGPLLGFAEVVDVLNVEL
jgi:hypothetical protein